MCGLVLGPATTPLVLQNRVMNSDLGRLFAAVFGKGVKRGDSSESDVRFVKVSSLQREELVGAVVLMSRL